MTERALNIRVIQIDRKEKTPATIAAILREIGIPQHHKGYRCLKEAIMETAKDPTAIDMVTKRLYPHVANAVGTTPSRAERAMRTAINYAWHHQENREIVRSIFGNAAAGDTKAPSNSHFISAIADCFAGDDD